MENERIYRFAHDLRKAVLGTLQVILVIPFVPIVVLVLWMEYVKE